MSRELPSSDLLLLPVQDGQSLWHCVARELLTARTASKMAFHSGDSLEVLSLC